MPDEEIVRIVRKINRLNLQSNRPAFRAIVEGFIRRLENHNVTEQDLNRLGL